MSFQKFLYEFIKIYVPGAIILCVIFWGMNYIPQQSVNTPQKPQPPAPQQQLRLPRPLPPVKPKIEPHVDEPEKPRYSYVIDLSSGGSMKAKEVKAGNNVVKIIISDSYDMTMSKNEIRSIKKYRL